MKNIFVFVSLMTISNLCYAGLTGTQFRGFPTKIQTTNSGVDFMISRYPSKIGVVETLKALINKIEIKVDEIHCEILKMKNPTTTCFVPSDSLDPIFSDTGLIHLRLNHPNYLALLQLLTTSYLAQNLLEFDVSISEKLTSQSSPVEYDYELNAIHLK